jgi:hypothetical protein
MLEGSAASIISVHNLSVVLTLQNWDTNSEGSTV